MWGIFTTWRGGSWSAAWICPHPQEPQSGCCVTAPEKPWPQHCICNLFAGRCWWNHLANSQPGSEEWTEFPLQTPNRKKKYTNKKQQNKAADMFHGRNNVRQLKGNLYLIFDHVHVVVCCLRLLFGHFLEMVHQVWHVYPEFLGIHTIRCRITTRRQEEVPFRCWL